MDIPPNPTPEPDTFQLGLCMAGAVSAGAYTAGALDFLIEALDSWDAARDRPGTPTHRVVLRAMSGASAGGMCAAILAALLDRRFSPARDAAGRAANPLWQAWVEQPDIAALLDPEDLADPKAPLLSLLNVGVLQQIVNGVLDAPCEATTRPWVARPLAFGLSVGNLRGVPYGMAFGGAGTPAYKMRMHADVAGFALGGEVAGHAPLATPAGSEAGNWPALGQAALASGAFPLFLRARTLSRPGDDYAKRRVLIPGDRHPGSAHRDDLRAAILPDWPGGQAPARYDHLCADGGIFDNEPLEACRRLMMDAPGQRFVRDGRHADRCVLMLDPFPDAVSDGPSDPATPLPRLLRALLDAWKMQCRFNAVDVALAGAPDVYSRMMLVPSRGARDEASGAPLAAGGLGAFLGFFHREFRAHDFALGRRNMQRFLAAHFALPADNPIFAGAAVPPDAELARHCKPGHLPLIPLIGACAAEEPLPRWPKGALEPRALLAPMQARLDALAAVLLPQLPGGGLVRLGGRLAWWWKKRSVMDEILQAVEQALEAKNLR